MICIQSWVDSPILLLEDATNLLVRIKAVSGEPSLGWKTFDLTTTTDIDAVRRRFSNIMLKSFTDKDVEHKASICMMLTAIAKAML